MLEAVTLIKTINNNKTENSLIFNEPFINKNVTKKLFNTDIFDLLLNKLPLF